MSVSMYNAVQYHRLLARAAISPLYRVAHSLVLLLSCVLAAAETTRTLQTPHGYTDL
jgi:hypothetical protein